MANYGLVIVFDVLSADFTNKVLKVGTKREVFINTAADAGDKT